MTDEQRLLAEYAEIEGGAFHEKLKTMRQSAVEAFRDSNDEKADLILKGELRLLDTLISEIEAARERIKRAREFRPDMSRAF